MPPFNKGRDKIRSLFARLTGDSKRGQKLFEAAVAEARQPHWFVEGEVPDSVEGRFAMLATVVALILVRLERGGGDSAVVALTERFIESLDAEIRQMGVGDPALGRQVRHLVGALASRVELWRSALEDDDRSAAVLRSVYRDQPPSPAALAHSETALNEVWQRLEGLPEQDIVEGRLG